MCSRMRKWSLIKGAFLVLLAQNQKKEKEKRTTGRRNICLVNFALKKHIIDFFSTAVTRQNQRNNSSIILYI